MIFVQYLESDGSAPCGDRAVFILDGRNSLSTWIEDAIINNGVRRPNYPFFQIRKGRFTKSTLIYNSFLKNSH